MRKNRLLQLAGFLILLLGLSFYTFAQAPSVPGDPGLYQATFTRAIISWAPSEGTPVPDGYKVYRDSVLVATVTEAEYTDTGLTADTTYVYTVKAYSGNDLSLPSSALTVKTLKNLEIEDASVIQQIVDSVDPLGLSAADLITAVQDALLALNYTNVDFSQINVPIFSAFITREMSAIAQGVQPSSDTARIADRQSLDQFLLGRYPGHSFVDLYLYGKLSELGEEHWQNGHPDAAGSLFEYCLSFLSDREPSVFSTLDRLAEFKYSYFNTYATRTELVTAVAGYKAQLMRFFDYFPNSTSDYAYSIYNKVANVYFFNFPVLLYYDSYDQTAYSNALLAIQAARNLHDTNIIQIKNTKILAWELQSSSISFKTGEGVPLDGFVDVVNISGIDVYPQLPIPSDIRRITLVDGVASVPMYKGHRYDLRASVSVSGGPAIKYEIRDVQHQKGFRVTCDHGTGSTVSALQNPNAPAEIVFLSSQPTAPYNLAAEITGSTFTLSWDWVPPSENYTLGHFEVYRGGVDIGSVTFQSMANIPLRSTDNTYTYTVKAFNSSNVASDESILLEVLPPDFTAAEAAYYAWKKKYFGNQPMNDTDDADNDGLSNIVEYSLGSNPVLAPVADVKSTLQGVTPGISVKYYQGEWTNIPDFSHLPPISSEVLSSPSFTSTTENILGSGLSDYMGASFSGYLDVPTSGVYCFFLTSDDGSRLYIDNSLLIDNDTRHNARERNAYLYMKQGVHKIGIDYFEYNSSAILTLEWAGPGFTRRNVDDSNLWICTSPAPLLDETIAWNKDSDHDGVCDADELIAGTNPNNPDSDNDGLTDFEELYIYHTNPNLADTDGDGHSDYEEVKVTFTDPNVSEFDNTCTTVLTVNGSQGIPIAGDWIPDGTALYTECLNGTVEYPISVANAGVYRLEIEATSHFGAEQKSFLLELLMDDSSCGSQALTANETTAGKAWFYLPKLQAGTHSAKIKWINVASNTFISISALRLQILGGPDSNSDGIPDWVDARNAALSGVTVPATSKVSPVCIEGANASNIEQISIEGFYTEPEQDPVPPVVQHSIENGWYSDVTLSPNAPSNLTISFQGGQIAVNRTVTWTPTNIPPGRQSDNKAE